MTVSPPPYTGRSASPWLATLPAHWRVSPLKYLVTMTSGGTPSKSRPDYWDGDVPWASAKDLKVSRLEDTADHITRLAVEEGVAELVPAGSILVVVRGMILAHSFPVVIAGRPMAFNQDLKALTTRGDLRPDYLAWLLRGFTAESLARTDEAGHGTLALRSDAWLSMPLPVPPVEEQRAIATFLDRETAKIDALVAEQERLTCLLDDKRNGEVVRLLTCGVRGDVRLRSTGLPWLGQVPMHWKVGALRHFMKPTRDSIKTGPFGSQLTSAHMAGGPYRVYTQRNVIDKNFADGDARIDEEAFTRLRSFEVFPGDVLLTTRGTIGRTAVLPADAERGILHPCLIRLQPDPSRLLPEFLALLVEDSTAVAEHLKFVSNATTIEVIYSGNIAQSIVAIPPLEEQRGILDAVALLDHRVDLIRDGARNAINLHGERRAALISAAVTGQIDVRGLVAA